MLHFVHYKSTYNKGINGAFCTIDFHEIDVINTLIALFTILNADANAKNSNDWHVRACGICVVGEWFWRHPLHWHTTPRLQEIHRTWCIYHASFAFKVGFHYPSSRPELTARVDGWPVSITRQHGPCWRARYSTPINSASGNARLLTGNGNRSPVNSGRYSGRQLG